MEIADLRADYRRSRLRREDLDRDPIDQFLRWLEEALSSDMIEPTAMSLATAWSDGRPMVRTVLLKAVDARGFVFFTNFKSRKAAKSVKTRMFRCCFPGLPLSDK